MICACSAIICVAQINVDLELDIQLTIIGIGYTILTIISISTYALELIAICRFVRFVRNAESTYHLNTVAISIQIFGLIIWTAVWVEEALLYLRFIEKE